MKHSVSHSEISDASLLNLSELEKKNSAKLNEYAEQLLWWNRKINLVSREVSRETVKEHIRHSLLIATTATFQNAEKITDTGTGGGLPGLPLAICFQEKNFLLNDIVSKKIMAVKQMALRLGLQNVEVNSDSIERVGIAKDQIVITKHAFKVWELTGFLEGEEWEKLIFLKGAKEAEEEIGQIEEPLDVHIIHLEKGMGNAFYSGKAIVEIKRK